MLIEHIQGLRAYQATSKHLRAKTENAPKLRPRRTDTYEPAKELIEDRSKLLETVRKRIKSGFYSSENVVDDLGDSFAKVLDQLI